MKEALFLMLLLPFFGFSQYKNKYYTKKQEIKGVKQFIDSVNLVLSEEIESLQINNDTDIIKIKKLNLKLSKVDSALNYLKKAKKKRIIGNIISNATILSSFITFQIANTNSTGFVDLSEIYFFAAGVSFFTGQAINIALKMSNKKNLQNVKELINGL